MSYLNYKRGYEYRSEPTYRQTDCSRWNGRDNYNGESSSSRYNQRYPQHNDQNHRYDDRRTWNGSGAREDPIYVNDYASRPYQGRSGWGEYAAGSDSQHPEYRDYGRRNDYNAHQDQRYGYEPIFDERYQPHNQYTPEVNRNTYNAPYHKESHNPPPRSSFNQLPAFPPTLPVRRPPSPISHPEPSSQSRNYSTQTPRSPRPRDRTITPPPVSLPPQEYLDLSSQSSDNLESDKLIPKLLVLDLNGALVFRNRSSDGRKSYPRPYLGSFLEYLFLPTPKEEKRGWEVFVWSSAQPHNVRGMVEHAFGPRFIEGIWEPDTQRGRIAKENGEGRLLGVWARDKMGLKESDYSRKVQTTKDLRKVLDHLRHPPTEVNKPPYEFDERTIVLLDDSPLKAIYQPFNQVVIPEYGKEEYQNSKSIAGLIDSGIGSENDGMDRTLLAVIGILDGLKNISNVPSWIRYGGLTDLTMNQTEDSDIKVENLPSHDDFKHWFEDEKIFDNWVEKGKQALAERGIEVKHGILPDNSQPSEQNSKPSSPRTKRHSPTRSFGKRGYHTNNGIDDDEVSSSEPQTGGSRELKPLDITKYLDELISQTSSLTIQQKNSLISARKVISDLNPNAAIPPISVEHQIPENTDNALGRGRNTEPSKGGKAKKMIGKSKKPKKITRAQIEYEAARKVDPTLSKRKFKAMKVVDAIKLAQQDQSNHNEEQESEDEFSNDDLEEISEEDFNRNLSVESAGHEDIQQRIGNGRRSIAQGSDVSRGSEEREKDESSKKLRSDSWSGHD
ncbi:uncharacterized protein L201_002399 [Kwoniella dendrophila CBS 6074]|uniref:FCP1 homology domain-containing protein n=1 Tax=Kwoniella dendrophila CBS 6074 TaxID=1295534 RepID=A0AAX4JQ54_9TREE